MHITVSEQNWENIAIFKLVLFCCSSVFCYFVNNDFLQLKFYLYNLLNVKYRNFLILILWKWRNNTNLKIHNIRYLGKFGIWEKVMTYVVFIYMVYSKSRYALKLSKICRYFLDHQFWSTTMIVCLSYLQITLFVKIASC